MSCIGCGKKENGLKSNKIELSPDGNNGLNTLANISKKFEIVKRSFSMDLLDVILNVESVLKNYKNRGILMRNSCLSCALKHITQSSILLSESEKGYPNHYWYSLGHLAEAEDELVKDFPDLANIIRNARIVLEKDRSSIPDYNYLIDIVSKKEKVN